MKATESISVGTDKDGEKIFIKRPCKKFATLAAYRKAFAAEAARGKGWKHPNLLGYIGLKKDETGEYIALQYVPSVPLNRALPEAQLSINNSKDSKQIMNQLMDAVAYLHARNCYHGDIRPENVFITRSAHEVRLANPACTYIDSTPSFFLCKEPYAAPELFKEDTVPGTACDIYSLGKVMEYLYSYSHLSPGIRRIVRKATRPNPAERYASVADMQKAFARAPYTDRCVSVGKGIAAIGLVALCYNGLKEEPASEEALRFYDEVQRTHSAAESPGTQAESPYYTPIPSDTFSVLPSDTLEFDEEAHRKLAEQIFKKEFRKRAERIVSGMYTPQMMNADEKEFQRQSMGGFSQLDKIQKELAEQFHMDPILTTRLSSEVISELTTESMKKLKQTADED